MHFLFVYKKQNVPHKNGGSCGENKYVGASILNNAYRLYSARLQVCHSEERSDVGISWYCVGYRSILPGDCHALRARNDKFGGLLR